MVNMERSQEKMLEELEAIMCRDGEYLAPLFHGGVNDTREALLATLDLGFIENLTENDTVQTAMFARLRHYYENLSDEEYQLLLAEENPTEEDIKRGFLQSLANPRVAVLLLAAGVVGSVSAVMGWNYMDGQMVEEEPVEDAPDVGGDDLPAAVEEPVEVDKMQEYRNEMLRKCESYFAGYSGVEVECSEDGSIVTVSEGELSVNIIQRGDYDDSINQWMIEKAITYTQGGAWVLDQGVWTVDSVYDAVATGHCDEKFEAIYDGFAYQIGDRTILDGRSTGYQDDDLNRLLEIACAEDWASEISEEERERVEGENWVMELGGWAYGALCSLSVLSPLVFSRRVRRFLGGVVGMGARCMGGLMKFGAKFGLLGALGLGADLAYQTVVNQEDEVVEVAEVDSVADYKAVHTDVYGFVLEPDTMSDSSWFLASELGIDWDKEEGIWICKRLKLKSPVLRSLMREVTSINEEWEDLNPSDGSAVVIPNEWYEGNLEGCEYAVIPATKLANYTRVNVSCEYDANSFFYNSDSARWRDLDVHGEFLTAGHLVEHFGNVHDIKRIDALIADVEADGGESQLQPSIHPFKILKQKADDLRDEGNKVEEFYLGKSTLSVDHDKYLPRLRVESGEGIVSWYLYDIDEGVFLEFNVEEDPVSRRIWDLRKMAIDFASRRIEDGDRVVLKSKFGVEYEVVPGIGGWYLEGIDKLYSMEELLEVINVLDRNLVDLQKVDSIAVKNASGIDDILTHTLARKYDDMRRLLVKAERAKMHEVCESLELPKGVSVDCRFEGAMIELSREGASVVVLHEPELSEPNEPELSEPMNNWIVFKGDADGVVHSVNSDAYASFLLRLAEDFNIEAVQ